MSKTNFSEINAKAAAVTGAVVGALCWVLGFGVGFLGTPAYGFMGGMMGYYVGGYGGIAFLYLITLVVLSALLGAAIGLVYNWALELK